MRWSAGVRFGSHTTSAHRRSLRSRLRTSKKVKARWFAGDEARAGIPDINRLKQHYAALRRSAPDTRSRLRGMVTLFVGLPVVLAKSHAFGGVERILGFFGRSIDHTRYAS